MLWLLKHKLPGIVATVFAVATAGAAIIPTTTVARTVSVRMPAIAIWIITIL